MGKPCHRYVSYQLPDNVEVIDGGTQGLLLPYVELEKTPAPTLTPGSEQQAGQVVLRIADNGPGIAAANLGLIFDPFFTTKPVGKGTGLGLSISYGIVEQHGGQLSAANLVQGGACFTLTLPQA